MRVWALLGIVWKCPRLIHFTLLECKKLDEWSSCKDDYMWNPSNAIASEIRPVNLTNI